MRREGFELSISRPNVLIRADEATGETLEPIEEVIIDVDDDFSGIVIQKMSLRKAELNDMRPSGGDKTRLIFHVPSRGCLVTRRTSSPTRAARRDEPPFHGCSP